MTRGGIILNIISIVLVAIGVLLYNRSTEKKIAFIRINKLYGDFQMKKELEGKYESIQKFRKNMIDSLELQLQLLSEKLRQSGGEQDKGLINEFESKKQNYLLKKQQFEEDNQATVNQYTDQITKQLNSYVQAYGKEYHYAYILGADGSGIMHADEVYDITDMVLLYVNNKYKGL